MTNARLLPVLNAVNRPFWTGGEQGKLWITQCRDCRGYTHPPRPICRHCLSDKVEPVAVSGLARIDTFTINHQAWLPGMDVPFVIARVALDDAPEVFLTTNIVGCPVEEVAFGDQVRVTFLHQEDVWLPLFEKVA